MSSKYLSHSEAIASERFKYFKYTFPRYYMHSDVLRSNDNVCMLLDAKRFNPVHTARYF